MKPSYDYFYRFPQDNLRLLGRCRVRIYERKAGAHTALLTELNNSSGESIASACERIATDLAAVRGLNPKTTRWIQHEPPHDDLPHLFEELKFTWDSRRVASDPQWQRLSDDQVEALTGASLATLDLRFGDVELEIEEGTEHAEAEAEGVA